MVSEAIFPDFSFAFQPIVNIATGSIISFEALVRGYRNDPASQVFQQVEQVNLYQFDELLRLKAISLAAKLGLGCHLNLNLFSKALLASQTAISSTLAMADSVGISRESITIEVTESEIIDDIDEFAESINQYRSAGIGIAIDDFGAGYSGLNLLADFQPDSIKIDMSLIRCIDSRGPRQAIVRGIIRTCRDLGIDIIAEGVETKKEYLWCYEEGIELFQGYFFAKPAFERLPVAFYPND